MTIRAFGPLGLAGRQRTRPAPWTVRVLPAFTADGSCPTSWRGCASSTASVVAVVRGQGSEFDSLRAYVGGDDPRSIDWRATARRGDVVVRTWRPERDRQVLLVLDTGRTAAGRVGGAPRFDAALDATLLLAALARHAGDRVGLLAHDRRVRAALDMTRQNDVLPAVMRATASLEPALVETDVRAVVAAVLRRLRRRSLGGLVHRAGTGRDRNRAVTSGGVAGEAAHRRGRVGLRPPSRRAGRRPRRRTGRLRCRRRRGGSAPSGPGSPRPCGGAAWSSSRHRPTASRRSSPTPTSISRPPAGCDVRAAGELGGDLGQVAARLEVEVAGLTGADAAPSEHPDVGEETRLGDDTDAHPSPRRQTRRRNERLDHPGDGQHDDQAQSDDR